MEESRENDERIATRRDVSDDEKGLRFQPSIENVSEFFHDLKVLRDQRRDMINAIVKDLQNSRNTLDLGNESSVENFRKKCVTTYKEIAPQFEPKVVELRSCLNRVKDQIKELEKSSQDDIIQKRLDTHKVDYLHHLAAAIEEEIEREGRLKSEATNILVKAAIVNAKIGNESPTAN